ncbi:NAD(P)-dependent oxidoreductase [Azospira inquinata]|nr:NAD(P)-dependent oxidoreductase [Azospira inquinata]
MARNLIAQGFSLTVYNRHPEKAEAFRQLGAQVVTSPEDAVVPGGVVISMLANDQAVEAVTLGTRGLLSRLGPGGLHISMSTVAPETSARLAKLHQAVGCEFLAAPVFGRPEAAAARKLWICLAGEGAAKARARPLLEALGQGVFDFGEAPQAANVVKLSGNFLILSAVEAMAEALALGEKNGVGREDLANFLSQTVFACPIYQNYANLLAQRRYEPAGFKLSLGMKDLRLVRETAESVAQPMPLADLLHARLLSALAKGRENQDWSAIELGTAEDGGVE